MGGDTTAPPQVFGDVVGSIDTVKPHCVAFNARQDPDAWTERTGPLDTDGTTQAVAFNLRGREGGAMPEIDPDNLACQRAASGGSPRTYLATAMQVRRLTPRECERLQGFPDDYTRIPWRGKGPADCPDGPRYRALGNSKAVPVVRWLGRRIAEQLRPPFSPTTT